MGRPRKGIYTVAQARGDYLYKRLSNPGYLHSNKDNFYRIVNNARGPGSFSNADMCAGTINRLKTISAACQVLEKNFYLDMGVTTAKEFEEKYLLRGEKKGFQQAVLQVLLRGKYQFNFKSSGTKIMGFEEAIPKIYDYQKFATHIFKYLSGGGLGTIDSSVGSLEEARSKFMSQVAKASLLSDKSSFQKRMVQDFNKIRHSGKQGSLNSRIYITSGENDYAKEFFRYEMKQRSSKIVKQSEMNEVLKVFNREVQKLYPQATKQQLQNATDVLERKIKDNLIEASFSSKSGSIGAMLEIGLEVTGLGIGVGNQISTVTNKKLAHDLEVPGKSGQIYRIQLKNSLDLNRMNIKIQDEISLETFQKKAIELSGDNRMVNEILYMILNMQYLNKNGLNKYGGSHHLGLSNQDGIAKQLKAYEQSLISSVAYYFLGQDLLDRNHTGNVGNLFFILKGTYLIPISLFINIFIGALEDPYNSSIGIRSLGGIQHPGITGMPTSGGENLFLQKKLLLGQYTLDSQGNRHYLIPAGFSYPDPLKDIGEEAYEKLIPKIKVNGLHYYVNLNYLEKNIDFWRK